MYLRQPSLCSVIYMLPSLWVQRRLLLLYCISSESSVTAIYLWLMHAAAAYPAEKILSFADFRDSLVQKARPCLTFGPGEGGREGLWKGCRGLMCEYFKFGWPRRCRKGHKMWIQKGVCFLPAPALLFPHWSNKNHIYILLAVLKALPCTTSLQGTPQ